MAKLRTIYSSRFGEANTMAEWMKYANGFATVLRS
jgi:hypothetical protein